MNILGISAFYHDSAACIIRDGEILAATEEERFSRVKHDNNFPYLAIEKCLKIAGMTMKDIDAVAYYEKPVKKLERILDTFAVTFPFSLSVFVKSLPDYLTNKLDVQKIIRKKLKFRGKIYYVPHHLSHAAAAFYTSPFRSAAILTIDGVGESETTSLWLGENNILTNLGSINFPNSLGLMYSTFTAYLGFQVNNDEYKMMGLSAYGQPKYADQIRKMIRQDSDGSFALEMKYFAFRESMKQMWSVLMEDELGKPRRKDEPFTRRHKDIAASIQKVTEEIYLNILRQLADKTGLTNVCIAGGVALNSLANGRIYTQTPFRHTHIWGAAGDSGAAVGAALEVERHFAKHFVRPKAKTLYLGCEYEKEMVAEIKKAGLKYRKYEENELITKTANFLTKGKVVGWYQGRSEFGPRALGNRSILARTYPKAMKDRVNRIKMREQFRPFAVSVLQDHAGDWFEVPKLKHYSPYMNFCFPVKKSKQQELAAVVHEDETCRIQTVNADNGRYYRLISEYYRLTGIPCILNTSFNSKIEPIVENPQQAIEDLLTLRMDYLVLGNYWISKPTRS